MKAIICTRYGSPDVLKLDEIRNPSPKDNEVLVKIYAASVNAADLELLQGSPFIRLASPFRPICRILGSDIAGVVMETGTGIKHLRSGDEVFADLSVCGYGAFAEYVCVPEHVLTIKPPSITFEQASTLPQAAILALQGLRDNKKISPGDKVLINGAGGGVGTFAVQIAKYFEAEVTGVDKSNKFDLLKSLGADHVIDYTKEDFTISGNTYDLIIDVVAKRRVSEYERALKPGGACSLVGGSVSSILQSLIMGPRIIKEKGKKIDILRWKPNNKEDLEFLIKLIESGKVKPFIERCFPLDRTPEALNHLKTGNALGKLVITIKQNI